MFATYYQLDNLSVLVDNNNCRSTGRSPTVLSPIRSRRRFASFGLFVQEIDGHDFEAIDAAFDRAAAEKGRPFAIVPEDGQGQGRLLHGGPGRLARQSHERGTDHAAVDELKAALQRAEGGMKWQK